jgi:hypothetical protein
MSDFSPHNFIALQFDDRSQSTAPDISAFGADIDCDAAFDVR